MSLKTKKDELELLVAVISQRCIDDFYTFFLEFWDINNHDDEIVPNWHIKEICDTLQRITINVINNVECEADTTIINIPPGMTKSSIISQAWPVWTWLRAPYFVFIQSSANITLSIANSINSKNILKSDRFNWYFQSHFIKKFGNHLRLTKDNEKEWGNNFGGKRFFTSVKSSVIGRHAHIIIWDDPHEQEEAHSEKARDRAKRHITKALPNRKKNKKTAHTVGVMQRMHEDDVTGALLKLAEETGKKINHIKLPADSTGDIQPSHLKDKYINGLLDPIRLDTEILESNKQLLGSYDYACQFDQEAFPRDGGKVKKSWFQYCTEDEVPPSIIWDFWIDGAYTEETKNDATGILKTGYDRLRDKLYVGLFEGKRLELPDFLKYVGQTNEGDGLFLNEGYITKSLVYFEPKASGKSMKQFLSRDGYNAKEIKTPLVQEGKESRLNMASPKIEAGKVILVKGYWNEEFIKQICNYPKASEDEAVDLLGYACERYFNKIKPIGPKKSIIKKRVNPNYSNYN